MVVGSYLMNSTNLRINDEKGIQYLELKNGPPRYTGCLTPTLLKERCELVFQLAKKKMKNLVIVNSLLSYFEMIQACVEVAEKYAENVMVIPPLLARMTYACEDLAKLQNPPSKEVILVVTVTDKFAEFVILRRDKNFELFIAAVEIFQPHQFKEMFPKFYDYYYPNSTILIPYWQYYPIAKEIQREFRPNNSFIKSFKKWDFVLLLGGIFYAMNDEDGFDQRYHIANFSSGFETTVQCRGSGAKERHVLLPERSALPCNIYGFNDSPQNIMIFYSPEYYQPGRHLILLDREAIKHPVKISGAAKEIIGYVDERGVPYASFPKTFYASKIAETFALKQIEKSQKQDIACLSFGPPISATMTFTHSPQIKFVFRDNFYAIQVLKNGSTRFLTDSSGKEWTPMYLSMADGKPEIGEKAKNDYQRFPKRVIYDVLKIIGKPMNEVFISPKWGFELTENDGIVYFQIETPSGDRLIPQELVLSAFLKAMKLQTQSSLETQIKEIRLSTDFELSESQKAVFEKAAEKNQFKILM